MFLRREQSAKIAKNRYYYNQHGVLVRVIGVNKKFNRVTIFRHDDFSQDYIEHDTAGYYLHPVFKIGDVARMLNRRTDTLRKYERNGLIPKPAMHPITVDDKYGIRIYTEQNILDLVDFFANRAAQGGRSVKVSKINQNDVMRGLKARYDNVKRVGGHHV